MCSLVAAAAVSIALTLAGRLDAGSAPLGGGLPGLVMHGGLGVDHTQFRERLDPLGDALVALKPAPPLGIEVT